MPGPAIWNGASTAGIGSNNGTVTEEPAATGTKVAATQKPVATGTQAAAVEKPEETVSCSGKKLPRSSRAFRKALRSE